MVIPASDKMKWRSNTCPGMGLELRKENILIDEGVSAFTGTNITAASWAGSWSE